MSCKMPEGYEELPFTDDLWLNYYPGSPLRDAHICFAVRAKLWKMFPGRLREFIVHCDEYPPKIIYKLAPAIEFNSELDPIHYFVANLETIKP